MVNLDRCDENCNTFNDPPGRICFLNKKKKVNLNVYNMIRRINVSKTLAKHISRECKCKFDSKKLNSDQKWKNDKF